MSNVRKPKLSEIPEMSTESLSKLFGPEAKRAFPRSQTGRIRLVRALANKFGRNFKAFPEARDAMTEFDTERDFLRKFLEMRSLGRK